MIAPRNARRSNATRVGLRALVLASAVLGACADRGGQTERRSVVLITLDTTRPDTLGAWGGPPGATPHLDALASQSLVYDRAYTVAPLTQPAHASMLTGLYPLRHGVRINGIGSLSEEARTLAEGARDAGYRTGAFVGAVVLDGAFGLDQGFDRYTAPARASGSTDSHIDDRLAAEVVDEAQAWLAQGDDPYFLWVHFFDPHGPYAPPEPFRLGKAPKTLYQGEVAYVDRQIGRLLEPLLAVPPGEAPLVLLVADHGEAFGEHGEQTHGLFCYDTTLRVPLLLRHPDGRRAGERSSEVVSVVDVYPTLAEAMNIPVADIDGRSLLGRVVPADRGVYFESYQGQLAYGMSLLAGWVDARGKYVHSSVPEFYAADDREEARDLAAERAHELEPYRQALARIARLPVLELDHRRGSDELNAALLKLGYAGAGATAVGLPDPLDAGERPSPHRMAAELADALQAQELSNQGRLEEAEALLREVLVRSPDSPFVMDRLATTLMRQGRPEQALPLLRRVVAEGPGWPGSWFNLGACLAETGQAQEALGALRRAVELEPGQELFRVGLAETLRGLGREEEARAVEEAGSR